MYKRIPIKNHQKEIQLVAKRAMQALVLICIMIGLLTLRLAYLQLYKNDMYSTLSTKNWLDLIPIEPTRGLIYDRNGVLLAENIPVFSLDVIPIKVSNLAQSLKEVRTIVSISDDEVSQFKRQLTQHRRFDEIPLKFRLSEEEVARFTENQYRYPGFLVKARLMRHYPFGESFSHVLGYVGRINIEELNRIDPINYSASNYIGKLGIEKFYENDLHGLVGYEQVESDASGKPLRVIKEIKGQPGKNLYLTLDSGLQLLAEKALVGQRGAVVAIDPNTGQVLALVSEPGYDPNVFVSGISQKDYKVLQTSEDRPLFNRAVRGLYPLASTIKPFLALEGLESGVITADDTIDDPGWFQLPNYSHLYHDWRSKGHGTVNMARAIMESCDTYFYDLASEMGIRRMDQILMQFGFGQSTGIDLDDELPGTVASPEWKMKMRGVHWYEGDTVISGIGQGFMQATPLQLSSATATLALRGKRFAPYLLLGEQTPGSTYNLTQPIPLDEVTLRDKAYWDAIINAMQTVVSSAYGTGYHFGQNRNYTIAGKTGTAQVVARRGDIRDETDQTTLPEKLRDHHWFIAFAPANKPVIAIAVITENSNAAIPAARLLFDYYLGPKQNANRPVAKKVQ